MLPKLEFSYIPVDKVAGGSFRLDLNGVAIGRDSQRNDQRVTVEMNWKRPEVLGNGQIWTFVLDARGDAYHFDVPRGTIRTTDNTIERGTAYAALDWRWPFIAEGGASIPTSSSPSRSSSPSPMAAIPRACASRTPRISNSATTMSSASTSCPAMT